ncbi:CBS domain-containing protein [Stygiolobus caldivivus]|uniref:Histidine kinase n=1 Tax=Stygiolobus caldivivus TaxID=2824673 RepID=A0A8D5ZJS3_9CREN|nr:CBS domain-containing protein [Stygiolobus caldivivus]BCU70936.1 histidine kinase [Stygiolobus caldivivus]
MSGIKVKSLITRPPIKVSKGTRTLDAVKLMAQNNVGSVLIMDGEKAVGIFTERDLLKAVAKGEDLNKPVEELGTQGKLFTVKEDDPVGKAALLMHQHNIRHLVVLDGLDKVIGVISIRDIISERHLLSALSTKPEEEWLGGD